MVPAAVRRDRFAVLLFAAATLIVLTWMPASPVLAANTGCTVNSATKTATCPTVPAGGISYVDNSNVKAVEVGNGPSATVVNDDVVGIRLHENGAKGKDAANHESTVDYGSNTTSFDPDGEGGEDPWIVLADADDEPIEVAGNYIRILNHETEDESYELRLPDGGVTGSFSTAEALAAYLSELGVGEGGTVTGDLTATNNADFTTRNANGIDVQSLGGKGGNGSCTNLLVASWCSGGKRGGHAASVAVTNDGDITVNDAGIGVHAVSVGGAGGNGGGTWGAFYSSAGSGGDGGNGGAVAVLLNGDSTIVTHGDRGHGVYASSTGGNGGRGGSADAAAALGSRGGDGGDAGRVSVTNHGSIRTHGDGAYGIFAQSIGAGAGDAGSGGGIYAVGGNGGNESNGNEVTVTNAGRIVTGGVDSFGIFAQSVGGGGGDGGRSSGLFSVGGRAGSGGVGNIVRVFNSGSVVTKQHGSVAILAQSIGGGGGNGGSAYAAGLGGAVAIGGSAGPGGDGAAVFINELTGGATLDSLEASRIRTAGDRAHGIQAQSIGGGGGNGGLAVAASFGDGFAASFAMGGTGGQGGDAGAVTVNEKGEIVTRGAQAYGIFAQSVGGGGGNGGGSVAATFSGGYSLGVAIGGRGDKGGSADAVTVNLLGGIRTRGDLAHGILAQSVGGGGGNGGFAVSGTVGAMAGSVALGGTGKEGGHGAAVSVSTAARETGLNGVHTRGSSAHAIFAQSVGGGGGHGGFAVSGAAAAGSIGVSLGGSGDGGGRGGAVDVANGTDLFTEGAQSYGLFAQSVGGGGGSGGFSLSATGGVMSAAVAVGGSGGAGGHGGNVTVDNDGTVITRGDLSYGLFAQSVGGSGGDGGSTVAAALTIEVKSVPAVGAAVAIGGAGGTASLGGSVTVRNSGSISTGTLFVPDDESEPVVRTGNGAHAILAQSVGGSGGTGGFAGSAALSLGTGASFGLAVGGRGGSGGHAGIVDVGSTGASIHTWGDGANGIHAQSVGGGGGDGGFGLALTGSGGGTTNLALSVAIGGRGGAGGTGNTVDVHNASAIFTDGANSNGIFAQSVGGGGGSGGFAASGSVAMSETAGGLGLAIGGGGGSGNFASRVSVDNAGTIATTGKDATGILAQSIGGGGGAGGLSVAAQFDSGTHKSAQVGVSIGGGGGSGNHAGEVAVSNHAEGSITTYGYAAHGIEAQSIGGGGGRGGFAVYGGMSVAGEGKAVTIGAAVGGNGGTGGYGNVVDLVNAGAIRVHGDAAIGILAQSVGGGGGDAGSSFTGMLGVANPASEGAATFNLATSVGGTGGSGNEGGVVTVSNTGRIETGRRAMTADGPIVSGNGGYGIFAQSVGGGGGIGGRANTVNIIAGAKCKETDPKCPKSNNRSNNLKLTATIGGNGGTGDHGGSVIVDNQGEIVTWGDVADGIFAQSIGGGGGVGGNGIAGSAEALPVPVEHFFRPVSQVSAHKEIDVTVGGGGGASGDGAQVSVTNSRDIRTHGDFSNGIFAQSVGGGGGVGGSATIGATGKIGLGGAASGGGDGGEVLVVTDSDALIETFGVGANGIFAQSVGGGGGMAGNVNRLFRNGIDTPLGHLPGNFGIGLAFGQSAGAGGDGGDVTVQATGDIVTRGDSAAGIFAQSVGGGGGVLGELGNDLPVLELLNWHIGSNGGAGDAGVVDVGLQGRVITAGNSATGIFAQSSGGLGTGADVNVTVDGQVLTAATLLPDEGVPSGGLGSVGVMAHSVGKGGNGNVRIEIAATDGLVSGGRSAVLNDDPDNYAEVVGIGVWIMDGESNTVTNRGTIRTADGVEAGLAIFASGSDLLGGQAGGAETIDNFGRIIGSVDLGAGNNAFTNHAGAVFDTGRIANIGVGQALLNDGRLNVGGFGRVMTTTLNGEFEQGTDGVYGVDLDLGRMGIDGEADLLDVAGELTLAGAIDLNILNAGYLQPGQYGVVVARSGDGLRDLGHDLLHPSSAVSTFSTVVAGDELVLNYGIDFAIAGLNGNQSAVGDYINAVQLAGGSDELRAVVDALFFIPDDETYAATLDQLLAQPYLANEVALLMAGLNFENSLMSCKVLDGDNRFAAEGSCAWSSVTSRQTTRTGTGEYLEYGQSMTSLALGAQDAIGPDVYAGFALGYDMMTGEGPTSAATGHQIHAGAVLKKVLGNTVVAGAVTAGAGLYDVTRTVAVPGGPSFVLDGQQNLAFASAHGRISHVLEAGDLYLKPLLDVGVTHVGYGGYTEAGGPLALDVAASSDWFVSIAPALELGGELTIGDDSALRPFARFGLGMVIGDAPSVAAGLVGAPDQAGSFTTGEQIDDLVYDLAVGIDLVRNNGFNLRLTGEARFGESLSGYGAQLKLGAPF